MSGSNVKITVHPPSTTSPSARASVWVDLGTHTIYGYAMTKNGVRAVAALKTGDGQRVLNWLATLDADSARRVSDIAIGPPGERITPVVYPRREILAGFLALPAEQRTVSAARALGIGVGYPGIRHESYPAITGLDGELVAITEDPTISPR